MMIRFHFTNNIKLDTDIIAICEMCDCSTMTNLLNRVLFVNIREFLLFMNYYCQRNAGFKNICGCTVNRKISIPEVVYLSMKLCHEEMNTFSIALIWRSFLLDIVECFQLGGLERWEDFKREVIESGENIERENRLENNRFIKSINNVHMTGINTQDISKIGFFTFGNRFLGHLRC